MNTLQKLLSKPLPSTRSGAFYNTFPYPTKISPEAIAVYLATITQPGDTILDAFGGSGSTGIAALLCEHPTAQMIKIAEELGVNPTWGKRNAVIYEIGSYGSFATRTLSSRLSASTFRKSVDEFVQLAENELGALYAAKDCDGNPGLIRHTIWSEVLICPTCKEEISYFQHGTKRSPVRFQDKIKCPHCGREHPTDSFDSATECYFDKLLGREILRKKRIPVWVYGVTGSNKWDRAATNEDIELLAQIEEKPYADHDKSKEIFWGELHRSGYHLGITHLHHFYSRRNYEVMYRLWQLTFKFPENVQNALQLLLLSYNATHCTMMTRVVAKQNAKDFVLTGAQSGVLYISKLPVEKNILLGLKRKSAPFYEAFRLLENCTGRMTVHNATSAHMCEQANSVDFVFTDPPFGDFIPYAEVNQINELWLEHTTNRADEVIISPSQNKSISDYQTMLTQVFSEINRVLKRDHYAAVIFHATKAKVWEAFKLAIDNSGLSVYMTSILDKKQASFKQVVSTGSVQGDPLVLLRPAKKDTPTVIQNNELLRDLIKEYEDPQSIDERRIYSLYVNQCLERGQTVTLDAKEVYDYVRSVLGRH